MEGKDREITRRKFLKGSLVSLLSPIFNKISQSSDGLLKTTSELKGNYEVKEMVEKAEKSFPLRWRPKKMKEAINYYKKANKAISSPLETSKELKRKIKNRLSQLYFEQPALPAIEGGIEELNYKEWENNFKEGKKYAIESLELTPFFASRYNGKNYKKTIKKIEKEDIKERDLPTFLFYAHNLGALVDLKLNGIVDLLLHLPVIEDLSEIITSYRKIKNFNKRYVGGSALSSLGATYANIQRIPGGSIAFPRTSMKEAEDLFKESIQEDRFFLMNRVGYSTEWATRIKDQKKGKEIFKNQLSYVLEFKNNEEILDKWPFWNREAVSFSEYLLDEGYEEVRKEKRKISLF